MGCRFGYYSCTNLRAAPSASRKLREAARGRGYTIRVFVAKKPRKTHRMTRQRCPYAVGVVFCCVLVFLWLTRDAASRVVLLPRTNASRLPRRHHEAPRGHHVYARGSPIFGELAQLRARSSASCDLQDAVRKKTAVGAVREDDLYVDTLQALSHSR